MQPINILLIEDNAGDIFLTTEILNEGRIAKSISIVKDGIEALDFLYKKGKYSTVLTPDLVLLDINLPKLNGLEVLEKIKTDRCLQEVPVIILSTSSSKEDITHSYKLFANGFITKPTSYEENYKFINYIKNFWQSEIVTPKNS